MQKPLENTGTAFERKPGLALYSVLGFVCAGVLLIGAIAAAANRNWALASVFVVALLLSLAFSAVVFRRIRKLSAALGQGRIELSAAMPDQQRQSLNIEVRELSKILGSESEQISDLQSAYIVAEDLALRQIQQEEGVPLMRHVSVGGVPFDAVLMTSGTLVCCETAFLVAPELRKDRIDAMLRKISRAKRSIEASGAGLAIRLMVVLVTQLVEEDEAKLRSGLKKGSFSDTPVDVDIRILDFESLQKLYVTD